MIAYIRGLSLQFRGGSENEMTEVSLSLLSLLLVWQIFLETAGVLSTTIKLGQAAFSIIALRCKGLKHCVITKYY